MVTGIDGGFAKMETTSSSNDVVYVSEEFRTQDTRR